MEISKEISMKISLKISIKIFFDISIKISSMNIEQLYNKTCHESPTLSGVFDGKELL